MTQALLCAGLFFAVGCDPETSEPLTNQPPTCTITAPADNTQYAATVTISVAVTATDSDGTITEVTLYVDNTFYETKTTAPYNFTIRASALTVGAHTLKAIAKDNEGATTESAAINITVPNEPPTCTITAPANNAEFAATATIPVSVTAADSDGTITEVALYIDNVLHSTLRTVPYNFTISASALSIGTHTLKALAKDGQGATTESAVVTISIKAELKLVSSIVPYSYSPITHENKPGLPTEYQYDAQKRLIKITENVTSTISYVTTFTYPSANTIIRTKEWNEYTLTLNDDGSIASGIDIDGGMTYTYTYLNGYLQKGVWGDYTNTFTWQNGNIKTFSTVYMSYPPSTYEYEYSTMQNKPTSIDLGVDLTMKQGFIEEAVRGWHGKSTANLISKMIVSGGHSETYRYETDSDGYVLKIFLNDGSNPEYLYRVINYQ